MDTPRSAKNRLVQSASPSSSVATDAKSKLKTRSEWYLDLKKHDQNNFDIVQTFRRFLFANTPPSTYPYSQKTMPKSKLVGPRMLPGPS